MGRHPARSVGLIGVPGYGFANCRHCTKRRPGNEELARTAAAEKRSADPRLAPGGVEDDMRPASSAWSTRLASKSTRRVLFDLEAFHATRSQVASARSMSACIDSGLSVGA